MNKWLRIQYLVLICCVLLRVLPCNGQAACPSNIGFEKGNFSSWQCQKGYINNGGALILGPSIPLYNSHTIFGRDSAGAKDYYGDFPLLCPNGSGYSVKLGNDNNGAEAEGITYEFTVPANVNDYSIIYNYAVVLQAPGHADYQQPRFTANVFDVSMGTYITCSSFEFKASASLPGFYTSPRSPGVQCKAWSAVTIDLAGYAGKTLRLEFSSNDCSLGAHFGYVYLDVNENCGSPVSGTYICPNDTTVTLTAPFGFSEYNWYTPDFSTLIHTGSTLTISPLPPLGTQLALEVIPFANLGCRDTLISTLRVVNDPYDLKVVDPLEACRINGADLTQPAVTAGSTSNMVLTYFSDAPATIPLSNPAKINSSGTYYIRGTTFQGCKVVKPVNVVLQDSPRVVIHPPPAVVFPATIDITDPAITSGSAPLLQYSYWKDRRATEALNNAAAITKSGVYYLKATSGLGCTSTVAVPVVINPPAPYEIIAPTAFSPNGDGINELFRINVKGQASIGTLWVYDRWGKLVGQDRSGNATWSGLLRSQPLPAGTYYWILEGKDNYTLQTKMHSGWVMIVR